MGAEHEADPAGPDQTSHDHADGQAFSVWTPRDQGGGSASGVQAAYESSDEPAPAAPASQEQQDSPGVPVLPGREPPAPRTGTPFPKRIPGQSNPPSQPPPSRPPADARTGTPFPKRVPGQSGPPSQPPPSQPPPSQAPAEPRTGTPFPKRVPGESGMTTRYPNPALPARAAPLPPEGGDANLLARTLQGLGGTASPPPPEASRGNGGGQGLPARAPRPSGDGSVLPVRTTRYRRPGRHSSPHLLSLPSDTPALVIAVPGSARPESEDIAVRVAEIAADSCHGAEVRIGFLRGHHDLLADVLDGLSSPDGSPAAVVVPLLAFPSPEADAAITDAVAEARKPFLIAGHLGPHPLLAEALHARLADVGLARSSRVGRISIVTGADGVIVGAAGNDLEGAGVVAVLLASRLTMPVAAASLTDPDSIKDAARRLRDANVVNIALAPCMIGPELTSGTLDAIAALTSTQYAPPLGGHPAIAQLVAIRYGAALADPKVASMMAEVRGPTASTASRAAPAPPPASGP